MKSLAVVLSLAVTGVAVTGISAQTTRSFGSVVFPGGTSSTTPGISRNFGSVVFPGGAAVPAVHGGAPVVGVRPGSDITNPAHARPGGQNFQHVPGGRNARSTPYVYAYPVYVGGGYDNGFAGGYPPQEQAPQQPNVTVVFPPSQHAAPVMIQAGPEGEYYTTGGQRQGAMIYDSPQRTARREPVEEDQPPAASDTNHYLIAFKDHTIYSAVAYWADGDTLHYFTSGNTHNQVSVSLIDRALTERLNKEMGIDFKLPPAK